MGEEVGGRLFKNRRRRGQSVNERRASYANMGMARRRMPALGCHRFFQISGRPTLDIPCSLFFFGLGRFAKMEVPSLGLLQSRRKAAWWLFEKSSIAHITLHRVRCDKS